MRRPATWNQALRALVVACVLVAAVLFVAANFVLVEVRLPGLKVEVRLAWAVVVPAALAFAAGMVHARANRAVRARKAEPDAPAQPTSRRGGQARTGQPQLPDRNSASRRRPLGRPARPAA
jgi:hypothetical protein